MFERAWTESSEANIVATLTKCLVPSGTALNHTHSSCLFFQMVAAQYTCEGGEDVDLDCEEY